jgi:hypothetical protein
MDVESEGPRSEANPKLASRSDVVRALLIAAFTTVVLVAGVWLFENGKTPSPSLVNQDSLPQVDVYSSNPHVAITLGIEANQPLNSANALNDIVELSVTPTVTAPPEQIYYAVVVVGAIKIKQVSPVVATPIPPPTIRPILGTKIANAYLVVGAVKMLSKQPLGDAGREVAAFRQVSGYKSSETSIQAQLPVINGNYLARASVVFDPSDPTESLRCSFTAPVNSTSECFSHPDEIASRAQLRQSLVDYAVLNVMPSKYLVASNVNWTGGFGLRTLLYALTQRSQATRSSYGVLSGIAFGIAGAGVLAVIQEIKGENVEFVRRMMRNMRARVDSNSGDSG